MDKLEQEAWDKQQEIWEQLVEQEFGGNEEEADEYMATLRGAYARHLELGYTAKEFEEIEMLDWHLPDFTSKDGKLVREPHIHINEYGISYSFKVD